MHSTKDAKQSQTAHYFDIITVTIQGYKQPLSQGCKQPLSFPGDCEAIGEPKANVTLGIHGYDYLRFPKAALGTGADQVGE
jgi:hypothetical protein